MPSAHYGRPYMNSPIILKGIKHVGSLPLGCKAGETGSKQMSKYKLLPLGEEIMSQEVVGTRLLQSCLTLCDPMVCSSPGSSVHGISQARSLEQVAISFPRGSSCSGIKPASPAWQEDFFTAEPPGEPHDLIGECIYVCYSFVGLEIVDVQIMTHKKPSSCHQRTRSRISALPLAVP